MRASFWPPRGRYLSLFRLLHRVDQARIGVYGLPLPPQSFRPQLEDHKMQVRRACIRISRRAHKTNNVPARDRHSLPQPFHVAVQVCVVVAILSLFVELIYGVAARFAQEQFANRSAYHRTHRCPSRFDNVDCFMPMSVVNFFERISQIRKGEPADGRSHLKNGRGPANSKNRQEERGNEDEELQACSSKPIPLADGGVPRRATVPRSYRIANFAFSLLEHDRRTVCNQASESGGVPVCEPHAPDGCVRL